MAQFDKIVSFHKMSRAEGSHCTNASVPSRATMSNATRTFAFIARYHRFDSTRKLRTSAYAQRQALCPRALGFLALLAPPHHIPPHILRGPKSCIVSAGNSPLRCRSAQASLFNLQTGFAIDVDTMIGNDGSSVEWIGMNTVECLVDDPRGS